MALTYVYEVTSLKVKDEVVGNTINQNAVVQTYWKLTGTDESLITEEGKNQGTFSGATPFTTTTMPEGYNFIPFADLTEQDVISWIQAVVEGNPGYKQHIDEQIQKEINDKMRPISEAALPWAPPTANT
jgi:hypothetical protein